MYDPKIALEQELAVFCALAPKELLDLVASKNLDHETKNILENLFLDLGLFELSQEFCQKKTTRQAIQDIPSRQECDTRNLLCLFMENIQSEGLRDLFDQKVDYLY